jgi:DNA primase
LWSQDHEHALAYLSVARGLTDETTRHYELGYDSTANAITLPVRDDNNALLGIKRRFVAADANPKAVNSRGLAALYPLAVFDDDLATVVLCEGEFDALLLNQHGIPAVTTTTGTGGWDKHPKWAQWFVGRHVAVIYDAGSYELAAVRAAQLRREGAKRAWPVDLLLAGLKPKEDPTDWFVAYARSADDLRDFINSERRRRRKTHNTPTVNGPCSSEGWSARGRSAPTS